MNTNTKTHIRVQVVSSLKALTENNSRNGYGKVCGRLTELLQLLSRSNDHVDPVTKETLDDFFLHNGKLVVAFDEAEKILGIGTLIFSYRLNKKTARIEDVFVDQSLRGNGFGKNILLRLMDLAVTCKAPYIDLTSDPSRIEANKLYMRLRFRKGTTNVYRLKLAASIIGRRTA